MLVWCVSVCVCVLYVGEVLVRCVGVVCWYGVSAFVFVCWCCGVLVWWTWWDGGGSAEIILSELNTAVCEYKWLRNCSDIKEIVNKLKKLLRNYRSC